MADKFFIRLGITSAMATNGTTGSLVIPCGSTYKTTSTTLVDSARDTKGYVKGNVVRRAIRKVEISWKVLDEATFSKIAKFMNTNFYFYGYYFDNDDNEWQTRQFYHGDLVASAVENVQVETTNDGRCYVKYQANVKLSFIEV